MTYDMEPIILKIKGNPVPWAAPQLSKKRTYDIRSEAKKAIVWALKVEFSPYLKSFNRIPLEEALVIEFFFGMPIPANTSKKKRKLMLENKILHTKKSDLTNCIKLYEDCLQRACIIKNDSQVMSIKANKFYVEDPHVFIRIVPISN